MNTGDECVHMYMLNVDLAVDVLNMNDDIEIYNGCLCVQIMDVNNKQLKYVNDVKHVKITVENIKNNVYMYVNVYSNADSRFPVDG